MADAARAFIYDAMDRIEKEARTALAATADGDTLDHAARRPAPLRETCAARHDCACGAASRMPCSRRIAIRSKGR